MALVAAGVLLGLAIRAWAASQWESNFDSDEAIFGLMALHIHQGDFVPTVYGTRHLGSIESVVAAGLFEIFEIAVPSLRLSALSMMTAFLMLHAWYVWRVWGRLPAIFSTAFLAVPGFHILSWTYQPIGAYAALLMLGTAFMLLTSGKSVSGNLRVAVLLGAVAGLGFWSNQMFIVYVVAASLPLILASDGWFKLRDRIERFVDQRVGVPPGEFLVLAIMALAFTSVVAFFSSGCHPVWQYERAQSLARGGLAVVGLGILAGLIASSSRRRQILQSVGGVGFGFLIGYYPLWSSWIAGSQHPVSVIRPSCPTGILGRTQLLVEQILPEMVGVRAMPTLSDLGPMQLAFWPVVLGASVVAVVFVLWSFRRSIWDVISIKPIPRHAARREVSLATLLILPIALSAVGSNTADIHSIRHLLVAWHATAIVFGLFISWITSRRVRIGAMVFVIWFGFLGFSNLSYAQQNWPTKFTRFGREPVSELETYLRGKAVEVGYADYWGAYVFDFLTQERLTIAPYTGLNRIPAYTAVVEAAPTKAFIFPRTWSLGEGATTSVLIDFLREENFISGEGPAHGRVMDWLKDATVISREAIGEWDVWILAE